ncbi:hypothetical protein niasHS_000428 [Heterodera schachtii]|uniref:Cytochrome P450 n=1 Tax=Heterodera schachtii TaxID=97005 RepID=A0ABD2K6X4_HETSC
MIVVLFIVLFALVFLIIRHFKKGQRNLDKPIALSVSQHVRHIELQQMSAEFGNFFALASKNGEGGTQFVTSDPAVANEIFVKKFQHFSDRKDFSSKTGHVFIASGDHWKKLRRRVSVFSNTKVKELTPLLNAAVDSLLRTIEANEEGKAFNFHNTSLHLVAAILARIAFCRVHQLDHTAQFCDTYTAYAEQLLLLKEKARLSRALPPANIGQNAQQQNGANFDMFTELYKHILELEMQKKHEQKQQQQQNNNSPAGDDDAYDEECQCHLFACTLANFFLENAMKSVGIDTIGHCLALVIHFMANRPLVQHRLREELTASVVGDEVKLVKAIIKETLRLCPIVSFASSRRCTSTPSSPCGVQLNSEKIMLNVGDSVEVDVFTMGRNRAVWGEDAEQFRPERWLDDGSLPADWQLHWLPFGGFGPRHCVGLPLANKVLETAISQLFRRFHFTSAADTSTEEIRLVGSDVLWPEEVLIRAEIVDENEDEHVGHQQQTTDNH